MNEFYEERKSEIEEAINTVFRFQLYRRGKIDTFDEGGKTTGDCIDTLLGCAVEYKNLMEENQVLKDLNLKYRLNELKNLKNKGKKK